MQVTPDQFDQDPGREAAEKAAPPEGAAHRLWEGIKSIGRSDYQKAPAGASTLQRIGSAAAPGTLRDRLARGAAGGAVGAALPVVGSAIGGALAPRLAPDAAALAQKGVPLSPGQMMPRGNIARDIEERATSLPILGKFIQDVRARSIDGFVRGTVEQALEPIGATLTPGMSAGHAVIQEMDRKIANMYKGIFAQIPKLQVDRPLLGEMANIELNARGRPAVWATLVGEWNHAFGNVQRLGGGAGPIGGKLRVPSSMAGDQMQRALSQLQTKARGLARSQDIFQREVGLMLEDGRSAVLDAVERQYPGLADHLRAANKSYAMAVRIGNAAIANPSLQGRFTPMGLLQASKAAARGVRRQEFAHGDALLQKWAEVGQRVLPSSLGESGTTPRAQLLNPVAWGVGATGRPIYGALASKSRSLPGAVQRGAAALARRGSVAAAPVVGPHGGKIIARTPSDE
jgi:hypothetical protein